MKKTWKERMKVAVDDKLWLAVEALITAIGATCLFCLFTIISVYFVRFELWSELLLLFILLYALCNWVLFVLYKYGEPFERSSVMWWLVLGLQFCSLASACAMAITFISLSGLDVIDACLMLLSGVLVVLGIRSIRKRNNKRKEKDHD